MSDADHMAHALRLGQRGLGRVWPNPAVGCVIVTDGRIVGRGWTQAGGRPHAEAMALAQAGDAARGATAYVTLEPCAHQGRAGPCAPALARAGVARVVTAMTDPDPRTAGQGHAILRAAGIAVTEGVLADRALQAHAGFVKRVTQGLPVVTLKLATTLDGRIATATGESRWITGPEARRMVHVLRLTHDAVMIAAGTAIADDPRLDARDIGATHQPVRVLLDRRLDTPPAGRLGRTARDQPLWIVHAPDAPSSARDLWSATGARLIAVADPGPEAALRALAALGLTRVLCEGGATLAARMIAAGLADDIALFTAGKAIGAEGLPTLGPLGLTALADAPGFALREARQMGDDALTFWSARPPSSRTQILRG